MSRLHSSRLCVLVSALVGLVMPFCTLAGDMEVWGSTTCQKRFLEPGAGALQEATGITVTVMGVGTGKGMLALFDGKTKVSAISSTLESAIGSANNQAKKENRDVAVPDDLVFHEINRDTIVPIVHKDNPVEHLSWAQLKDIHTGKIDNWSAVGGPELAIRVVTSHPGSATRAVFQKMVMGGADYAPGAKEVASTRRELDAVSRYKGAIGAVSKSFFEGGPGKTKIVATDPIERPLGLVTVGAPEPEIQKMIDFYRSQ